MKKLYFAPMEGITDAVFRRVHHECFPSVNAYYIPFISPTQHLSLNGREKRNVLPEYNRDVPCVPQVLTRDPQHFLWAAQLLADMGYTEVNLNAGCPSGTVTAKGKGAGMLRDAEALARFLDAVCTACPLPISVKTRIGFESPEEWETLLSIYCRYPIQRLIVHPRTNRERYSPGTVHPDCITAALSMFPGEVVVNGDLFTPDEVNAASGSSVMLGRGLIANPALARMALGGEKLTVEELVHYHDALLQGLSDWYEPNIVFMKLRVIMKHIACCFDDAASSAKKIRKARNLSALLEADRQLLQEHTLSPQPCFDPTDP